MYEFARVEDGRLGLIAEPVARGDQPIVAFAQYESIAPRAAEGAFVVRDDWQGQGVGTTLLRTIVAAGEDRDIEHFQAFVLGDNTAMLRLLRRHSDVLARTVESGVVEVLFRQAEDGV